MKRNGYQEFEERESLKREKSLNSQLIEALRVYNEISKNNLEERIRGLEKVLVIYQTMKDEGFDFDVQEYKRIEEQLKYLNFRKSYIAEYGIEEITEKELQEYTEKKKKQEEENYKAHLNNYEQNEIYENEK